MSEVEEEEGTQSLLEKGSSFDLKQAFLLRQDQLLATLGVGRSAGSHPVVIGDDSELNWRGMLDSVLPSRYRVSKGFAIDTEGRRSDQIDLLIYDRHFSPVLLDVGDYVFVPAEAVFAAIEVKQRLTRENVEYGAAKVKSVRTLRRTSAPVPYVEGAYSPKKLQRIIGGMLTMESDWSPPLGDPLEKALADFAELGALDIGCALRHGSFDVEEDGKLTRCAGDQSLIFFVLRLLRKLQLMGSPPAIDFAEYSRVLDN